MCVASGVLITRTISSSTHAGSTSNSRRPATEQHRDLVNLQVVQHARLERALRRVRAVHQHLPVPGGGLRCAIVRQEVEALEVLGVDTIRTLVVPRMVAVTTADGRPTSCWRSSSSSSTWSACCCSTRSPWSPPSRLSRRWDTSGAKSYLNRTFVSGYPNAECGQGVNHAQTSRWS